MKNLLLCAALVACDGRRPPQREVNAVPPALGMVDDMVGFAPGSFIGRDAKCDEATDGLRELSESEQQALALVKLQSSRFEIDRRVAACDDFRKCVDAGACTALDSYCSESAAMVPLASAGAYCAWRGKRVILYAEWQRAIRGVDGLVTPTGATWTPTTCPGSGRRCRQTSPDGVEYTIQSGSSEWTSDTGCEWVGNKLVRGPIRVPLNTALLTEIAVDPTELALVRCSR
jgi:hypothetical protein